MDASGLLHLLKAEPTLLPAAPDGASGEVIEQRRHKGHPCLSCGQPAATALIVADPQGAWQGKRWLDLCYDHFDQVRAVA